MKFSDVFTSKDNIQLDKKTLVILRWIAIVGQFFTLSIVYFFLSFELPFLYCSAIILCVGVGVTIDRASTLFNKCSKDSNACTLNFFDTSLDLLESRS